MHRAKPTYVHMSGGIHSSMVVCSCLDRQALHQIPQRNTGRCSASREDRGTYGASGFLSSRYSVERSRAGVVVWQGFGGTRLMGVS